MLDELLKRATQAVESARSAGAQDAFAWASRTRSVELGWRESRVEKIQEATSRNLAIDLYVDGRYSSHTTCDLRPAQLEAFIRDAVVLTRALQPDPTRLIPDAALFQGRPSTDLDQVDPAVIGITQAQREAWIKVLDERGRTHDKVISVTSAVGDEHTLSAGASSNGFSGTSEQSSVSLSLDVTMRDEGDKRPEGSEWAVTLYAADLPDPVKVGDRARERALARLGAKKGPSGRMNLVVDPRAGGRLIRALTGPATAMAIHRSQSFWAGHLAEERFSKVLSITDEPLRPRGLASRHFDGEGISARTLPIVEKGAVRNIFVDTYYGRKLGMAPTTGQTSNLVVGTGVQDLAALLAQAGSGIYVTSWIGGNQDNTTGDFSFGIQGHLIEGGRIGAPVAEMNVTGNLVTLFQHLTATGNDPWPYSSLLCPTLLFEEVEFSGV